MWIYTNANLLKCEFTQMQIYTNTNLHKPWRSHRHTLVTSVGDMSMSILTVPSVLRGLTMRKIGAPTIVWFLLMIRLSCSMVASSLRRGWCYNSDFPFFFFYLIISDSPFLTHTVEQCLLTFQITIGSFPFSLPYCFQPLIISSSLLSPFSYCS